MQASSIAQQAIASVRTVMAYNAQDAAERAYSAALEKPAKVCVCVYWVGKGAIQG